MVHIIWIIQDKDKNYIISFKWRWIIFRQIGTKCIYDQMWLDTFPIRSFGRVRSRTFKLLNLYRYHLGIIFGLTITFYVKSFDMTPISTKLSCPNSPEVRKSPEVSYLGRLNLKRSLFGKILRTSRLKGVGPECGNGIYVVCVPFYDRNFVVFHEK